VIAVTYVWLWDLGKEERVKGGEPVLDLQVRSNHNGTDGLLRGTHLKSGGGESRGESRCPGDQVITDSAWGKVVRAAIELQGEEEGKRKKKVTGFKLWGRVAASRASEK